MNPFETLIVLVIWAIDLAIAIAIGRRKGHPWTGFLLGFLLGPIGVIVIAVVPPTHGMRVQRERERLQVQREASGS